MNGLIHVSRCLIALRIKQTDVELRHDDARESTAKQKNYFKI